MAVIMNTEIAGADASVIDGMRAAGVVDAIPKAPGFLSHISGASSSGYRVIEVWESREAHQAWYDNHSSEPTSRYEAHMGVHRPRARRAGTLSLVPCP